MNRETLERLSFNAESDLSRAEIALIGGTLEDFNPQIFFEQLEVENDDIFIPIGILDDYADKEQVNARREQQEFLSGVMVFLDEEKQLELNKKMLQPVLYLDPYDENFLTESRKFRLGIISYTRNIQDSDLTFDFFSNSMKESYQKYFDIKKEDTNVYMVTK